MKLSSTFLFERRLANHLFAFLSLFLVLQPSTNQITTVLRHVRLFKGYSESCYVAVTQFVLYHRLLFLRRCYSPHCSLGLSAHMDIANFCLDFAWALVRISPAVFLSFVYCSDIASRNIRIQWTSDFVTLYAAFTG